MHGFVVSFNSQKSKVGNEFFDVNIKVSATEISIVRIMKNSNNNITASYLSNLKEAGAPMAFTLLSSSSNGIHFFNSYRGSRIQPSTEVNFSCDNNEKVSIDVIKQHTTGSFDVSGCMKWLSDIKAVTTQEEKTKHLREAVLYDETGDMPLTLWEEHFEKIKEFKWYHFTRLNLKNFYGLKLSSSKSTSITEEDGDTPIPQLDKEEVDKYVERSNITFKNQQHITLCCPEISNLSVELYFGCSNNQCKRQVSFLPGKKIINCIHCSRTMRADKCEQMFKCNLSLGEIELDLPSEIISSFLDVNVIDMCLNDMDNFKETILFLENIDYIYNIKNIIVEMKKHDLQ